MARLGSLPKAGHRTGCRSIVYQCGSPAEADLSNTITGWPEAIADLMWPNGEMRLQLSEMREVYPKMGGDIAESLPVALSIAIVTAAAEGFYEEDKAQALPVQAAMPSSEAARILKQKLLDGELSAKGRLSDGGNYQPIDKDDWHDAEVKPGAYGHDLCHRSGQVIAYDVVLSADESGRKSIVETSPKPSVGARPNALAWQQYGAALAACAIEGDLDDCASFAAIHKIVADFLMSKGHSSLSGDSTAPMLGRFMAWREGQLHADDTPPD